MAAPIKIITFGETSTDKFEYSFVINPIANGRIAFPRKYPINNPHGNAISKSHSVCIRTKNLICFWVVPIVFNNRTSAHLAKQKFQKY